MSGAELPESRGSVVSESSDLASGLDRSSASAATEVSNSQAAGTRDWLLRRHASLDLESSISEVESKIMPKPFASRLKASMEKTLRATDIYAMLAPQDDEAFKSFLRDTWGPLLQSWITQHEDFSATLSQSGLGGNSLRRLERLNDAILRDLRCLKDGEPMVRRALRTGALLPALPLPLAVTSITGEKKSASYVIARLVRNLVATAALVTRDSSNGHVFRQFFDNRILPSLLVWSPMAIPAFFETQRPLLKNPAFTFPARAIVESGVQP